MIKCNIKHFVILLLIIYEINFAIFYKYKRKKIIYTFWEPKEKIPGYLSLCIKTWKKFLPEYKVIILDYKKSKNYLGVKMFNSIISQNMSTMVQTDAIRVAILNKYGGIWMDADNIVTNGKFIQSFQKQELVMVWDKFVSYPFIAFIYTAKKSSIIQQWLDIIIDRVNNFTNVISNPENTTNWLKLNADVNEWFFLGNGIINNLIKNVSTKKFLGIHCDDIQVFPELKLVKNDTLDFRQKYELYFFNKGDPQPVLDTAHDFIFLQNSWTPPKYKQMTEDEFLHQDILLSKLLAKLLDIKV